MIKHDFLIEGNSITETWYVDDVLEYHPRLTEKQARNVLYWVDKAHDANLGINWDIIEYWVEELGYESGED